MREFGIDVASVERLNISPLHDNRAYLRTKRDRMGHDLVHRHHGQGSIGMSGEERTGAITVDGSGCGSPSWPRPGTTTVMDGLIAGARRGLADAGVEDVELVRVPGAFELTVACARLAPAYDAVVALGVVIRGGTPHFDYVCQAATSGLTDVSARTGVPVGFGVLTCDDEHAGARPRRARGLARGQGSRGSDRRGGHGGHPARRGRGGRAIAFADG